MYICMHTVVVVLIVWWLRKLCVYSSTFCSYIVIHVTFPFQTRVSPDKIQFFCSLEGLGISLVNNTPKEIAYFTIIR